MNRRDLLKEGAAVSARSVAQQPGPFQELNKSGVPATFGCQHPGHA